MGNTVAIIHATPATMQPVVTAFGERFPEAELWHLLDDRLVKDADAAGGLTPPLRERMRTLIEYAVQGGAEAVQLACSMYGPVAGEVQHDVPVLASDQAMFEEVVRLRPRRVGVIASLVPAAADSEERLRRALRDAGQDAEVVSVVADEAVPAAAAGDTTRLAEILGNAAAGLRGPVDVFALAQYSLGPVAAQLSHLLGVPVLSATHLAATTLRHQLEGDG